MSLPLRLHCLASKEKPSAALRQLQFQLSAGYNSLLHSRDQSVRLLAGTPYDRPPTCDRCGKPESECQCPALLLPKPAAASDRKTVRLAIEKRKKGKVVSVIRGLSARQNNLPALLSKLKSQC